MNPLKLILKSLSSLVFISAMFWLVTNSKLTIYLVKMGIHQSDFILNSVPVEKMLCDPNIPVNIRDRLLLCDSICEFSTMTLGYSPTRNFQSFYDQRNKPKLWVISACKPYSFDSFYWEFPLLGKVPYKGYFVFEEAWKEFLRLRGLGYDTDISHVSAWSTLGWLPDPLLSTMLYRSKGDFVNLLLHELFHATYYAKGTVEVNENLADFFAHKGTILFLSKDSSSLGFYISRHLDDSIYNAYLFRSGKKLDSLYKSCKSNDSNAVFLKKVNLLRTIFQQAEHLRLSDNKRFKRANQEILLFKNSFFMQVKRYDGLYDSLNHVLDLRFSGNLKMMILDLTKK